MDLESLLDTSDNESTDTGINIDDILASAVDEPIIVPPKATTTGGGGIASSSSSSKLPSTTTTTVPVVSKLSSGNLNISLSSTNSSTITGLDDDDSDLLEAILAEHDTPSSNNSKLLLRNTTLPQTTTTTIQPSSVANKLTSTVNTTNNSLTNTKPVTTTNAVSAKSTVPSGLTNIPTVTVPKPPIIPTTTTYPTVTLSSSSSLPKPTVITTPSGITNTVPSSTVNKGITPTVASNIPNANRPSTNTLTGTSSSSSLRGKEPSVIVTNNKNNNNNPNLSSIPPIPTGTTTTNTNIHAHPPSALVTVAVQNNHQTDEDILAALLASDSEDNESDEELTNAIGQLLPSAKVTLSTSRLGDKKNNDDNNVSVRNTKPSSSSLQTGNNNTNRSRKSSSIASDIDDNEDYQHQQHKQQVLQQTSKMTPAARNAALVAVEMHARARRMTQDSIVSHATTDISNDDDDGNSIIDNHELYTDINEEDNDDTPTNKNNANDIAEKYRTNTNNISPSLRTNNRGLHIHVPEDTNESPEQQRQHQQRQRSNIYDTPVEEVGARAEIMASIELDLLMKENTTTNGTRSTSSNNPLLSPDINIPSPLAHNLEGSVLRASQAVAAARTQSANILNRISIEKENVIMDTDNGSSNVTISKDIVGTEDLDLESIIQSYSSSSAAATAKGSVTKGTPTNNNNNNNDLVDLDTTLNEALVLGESIVKSRSTNVTNNITTAVASSLAGKSRSGARASSNVSNTENISTNDRSLQLLQQSVTSLHRAATRQTRLLRLGNTKMISPLASHRRFRPGIRIPHQAIRAARSRVSTRSAALAASVSVPQGSIIDGFLALTSTYNLNDSLTTGRSRTDSVESTDSVSTYDDSYSLSNNPTLYPMGGKKSLSSLYNSTGSDVALTGFLRNGRSLLSPYRTASVSLLPPSLALNADGDVDIDRSTANILTTGRSTMGLLRVSSLLGLSDTIRRNIKNLNTNSSGMPTCITTHTKFTAIGTSRSLVLLFDANQELKCILARTVSTGNAATDGAVTSLDALPGTDLLMVGYSSGRVALVDTSNLAKSSVLKVAEVHRAPIASVRFITVTPPAVLSIDVLGVVNFLTFSKVLGVRWSSESRCILDGSKTGPVVAVAVLLPPSTSTNDTGSGTSNSNVLTAAFTTGSGTTSTSTNTNTNNTPPYGSLIAISTRESTYILITNPDLNVIHRWTRPDGIPATVVPSLSWARGRVHGSAALDAVEERRAAASLMLNVAQSDPAHIEGHVDTALVQINGSVGPTGGITGSGSRRSSFTETSSVTGTTLTDTTNNDNTKNTPKHLTPVQRNALANRYRNGSTLPYHGVLTTLPVPVLARAWGTRLQFLQIQPPGGYPLEQTNLAPEPIIGENGMLIPPTQTPPGYPGNPKGSVPSNGTNAVFGTLTPTLDNPFAIHTGNTGGNNPPNNTAGIVGGPNPLPPNAQGRPLPPGVPSGPPSSGTNPGASASRIIDFVLADDLDSQDGITSIAWLGNASLVYVTATDRICLLDTAALEEMDVVELQNTKLAYATVANIVPNSNTPPGGNPSGSTTANSGNTTVSSSAVDPLLAHLPPLSRTRLTSSLQNAVTVSNDGTLFVLGNEQVIGANIMKWNERVNNMVGEGEWISALALALDTYESTTAAHLMNVATAERQAKYNAVRAAALARIAVQSGANANVISGMNSGNTTNPSAKPPNGSSGGTNNPSASNNVAALAGANTADAAAAAAAAAQYDPAKFQRLRTGPGPAGKGTPLGDELERLLKSYVAEMVVNPPGGNTVSESSSNNAPLPPSKPIRNSKLHRHGTGRNLAETHWVILASIVIDYCVTIRRTDLLFGEIFDRFHALDRHPFFLEQLEPYIMNDRLGTLPPTVLKSFVDHFRSVGALSSVERCLLHLDLTSLDIDGAVRTCLRHRLYSALAYVINAGLMDYSMPIDLFLAAMYDTSNSTGTGKSSSRKNSYAYDSRRDTEDSMDELGMNDLEQADAPPYGRKRRDTNSSVDVVPLSASDRSHLGYALLLYIAYAITGRTFPSGRIAAVSTAVTPTSGRSTNGIVTMDKKSRTGNSINPLLQLLLPLLPQELLQPVTAALFGGYLMMMYNDTNQSPIHTGSMMNNGSRGGGTGSPQGKGSRRGNNIGTVTEPLPSPRVTTWDLLFAPADRVRPMLQSQGTVSPTEANNDIRKKNTASTTETSNNLRSPVKTRYGSSTMDTKPPTGTTTANSNSSNTNNAPNTPRSNRHHPSTLQETRGTLPPGTTLTSLRADTLSYLLSHKPERFPAVGASLLSTGGLLNGATLLENLPGSSPRLQALLRFDPITTLQLFGRLFTDAADAVLHTVLLTDGLTGLRIRRRCLPGEVPSLVDVSEHTPALMNLFRSNSNKSSVELSKGGTTGGNSNVKNIPPIVATSSSSLPSSLITATGPSLQSILNSLTDAMYGYVLSTTNDYSSKAYGSSSNSNNRFGNNNVIPEKDRERSLRVQDNRIILILIFIIHQISRMGAGLPPIVTVPHLTVPSMMNDSHNGTTSSNNNSELFEDILFWLTMSPYSSGSINPKVLNNNHGRESFPPNLSDTTIDNQINDEIMTALIFAWDVRTDDDLFISPSQKSVNGSTNVPSSHDIDTVAPWSGALATTFGGNNDPSHTSDPSKTGPSGGGTRSRSSSLVDAAHSLISPTVDTNTAVPPPPSTSTSSVPPLISRYTREILLLRLLRVMDLPYDLRRDLLDSVRANDMHKAACVLHARNGDACSVMDSYIRISPSDAHYSRRVFRFLRSYVSLLNTAGNLGLRNLDNNDEISPNNNTTAHSRNNNGSNRNNNTSAMVNANNENEVKLVTALLSPDVTRDPEHEKWLALMIKAEFVTANMAEQTHSTVQRNRKMQTTNAFDDEEVPLTIERYAEAIFNATLPPSLCSSEIRTLRLHIMKNVNKLVTISERLLAELIVDLFPDKPEDVLASLDDYPRVQYAYLTHYLRRAGVLGPTSGSGMYANDITNNTMNGNEPPSTPEEDAVAIANAYLNGGQAPDVSNNINVPPEIHIRYIGLLCRFDPRGVVTYLSMSTVNYPLDTTLTLVRDTYGNAEATAFLLERTGDVRGALEKSVKSLEERLDILYAALLKAAMDSIETQFTARGRKDSMSLESVHSPSLHHVSHIEYESLTSKLFKVCTKEEDEAMEALNGAIAMCTRSAVRFSENEVETLWFRTLDALVLRQRDTKNELINATNNGGTVTNIYSSPPKGDEKGMNKGTNNTKALSIKKAATAMLQMLGEGIKTVLETMKSSVPLNRVLNKVLSDHSRAEFSEFRETIMSMMSTYAYEGRLLGTANHLMSVDIFRQVQRLHHGYAAAVAPSRSRNLCAACNTNLVIVSGGGKIVTVANNNSTEDMDNQDNNYGETNDDLDGETNNATGGKTKSTNSLFMVFGCGHCYHERCLPMASNLCPLCTQKENNGTNGSNDTDALRSTTEDMNGRSFRRGQLFAGKVAMFGDTSRLRTLDNNDNDGMDNDYTTTRRPPMGGDNNNTDGEHENIYMERLNRTKEKLRRSKPLIEILDELSLGSGKIQIRNMTLDTAVPTGLSSDEFKIVRNPPKLRNRDEATSSCTYAKIDVPAFTD